VSHLMGAQRPEMPFFRTGPQTLSPSPPLHTIKRPHPAVCFTDQTLRILCDTFANFGGRFFFPYRVALTKTSLYDYGARAVIYGDDAIFAALPPDWQYLWDKDCVLGTSY